MQPLYREEELVMLDTVPYSFVPSRRQKMPTFLLALPQRLPTGAFCDETVESQATLPARPFLLNSGLKAYAFF